MAAAIRWRVRQSLLSLSNNLLSSLLRVSFRASRTEAALSLANEAGCFRRGVVVYRGHDLSGAETSNARQWSETINNFSRIFALIVSIRCDIDNAKAKANL